MEFGLSAALRSRVSCVLSGRGCRPVHVGALFLAALILASGVANQGFAQQSASLPALVIRYDRGGYVLDRLRQISRLRRSGRKVEITGSVCYSSCTMLLGLPQTCISQRTVFGFHGPSAGGKPLPREEFEYYSRVMARYYPEPLRDWFMREGRFRIHRLFRIRGSRIIAMGIRECGRPGDGRQARNATGHRVGGGRTGRL